jgi:prolyl-tRNA synthetase
MRYVTHGRDFNVDGFIEAVEINQGDPCPSCDSPIIIDRAIEIGHIFQLGRKYAQALDLTVLDSQGKSQVVTMGSYGIGVTRALAAIAEQSHDEIGIIWPDEIAPAKVHIVATGREDEPFIQAERIGKELEAKGISVMIDDRREASPGVKFKDAELIGNPYILIFGKSLAQGQVEFRIRRSGEKSEIALGEITSYLVKLLG